MFHWTIHLEGEHRKDQAAVVIGHKIYCFGGDRNQRDHIEVHIFNTESLCWRKLTPGTPETGEPHLEVPSRREGHTAGLIEYTVYLWGGHSNYTNEFYNRLHAFDVDSHTWFKPQVSGNVPEGRCYPSACVLGKVMFTHGGSTQTGLTNDIYKLDTIKMVWSLINARGTPPPDLWRLSATIIGTKMFVFGGSGRRGQLYNTIRVFDTESNQWMNTPSTQLLTEGRRSHSAFTYNGELYIFGCFNQYFNALWKFNPETSSWKKVKPKGKLPHGMKNMCGCMVGDRIILFGSYNRPGDLDVVDFSPSFKTLCKPAVIQYGLDQSELPHNIRWELTAMTSNSS